MRFAGKATTTVQVYKSLGSRGQQRQQKTDITSKTAIRTNLQVHRYQQGEMKFLPSSLQQFKHQHEKAIHMISRSSGARLWISLLKTRELENVMLPQTNMEPKKTLSRLPSFGKVPLWDSMLVWSMLILAERFTCAIQV